jgi:hypothetical protein
MFDDIINPTTVIDDDEILATGAQNVYTLTDVTDPQNPHSMENLTEKYFYDILIIGDNEESVNFATGTPKTLLFTDGTNTYPINYLGNFSLWNHEDEYDTGESYLFIVLNNQTYLYVGEENQYYSESGNNEDINFLIQKSLEINYEVGSLVGGALISFANYSTHINTPSTLKANYGIGINSSDSAVNLPDRAISLFETEIYPDEDIKVGYNFRGILGKLPALPATSVNTNIYDNMRGTQGIYTDNMYLGDLQQYLAFYTDKGTGEKKLKISAAEISFEIPDEHGQGSGHYQNVADIEAEGVPGPPGEDARTIRIESNIGNNFVFGNRTAILTCYVYKGTEDITSTIDENNFNWSKMDKEGQPVSGWTPYKQGIKDGLLKNQIMITTEDVDMKSVFYCNVSFD